MSTTLVTWGARLGCAAAGGAAATAASDSSFSGLIRGGIAAAVESLRLPAQAASTAVARADDLHAAALTASVRAIEAMLQQQRSSSSMRLSMLLAVPVAAGLATYFFGWASFGWVTPLKLEQGLESVRAAVGTCAQQLGEKLHLGFAHVDAQLTQTAAQVVAVKEELSAEVRAVGECVASLEQRIAPMESDMHRTAQGVGLLCEVVAGLSNNASPELRRRLDSFTGVETLVPPAAPPAALPAPSPEPAQYAERLTARPELLSNPPAPRSDFLRALVAPPLATH